MTPSDRSKSELFWQKIASVGWLIMLTAFTANLIAGIWAEYLISAVASIGMLILMGMTATSHKAGGLHDDN